MNKYIITLLGVIAAFLVNAQEVRHFSLEEAVAYAMENNYDLINSRKNIDAAEYSVKENTAIGLPQLNASVGYNDNFARPVMILPSEFVQPGQSNEVQFGTKYDANLGANLSQLIFSGEYIVGLQAAKKYLDKTTVDFIKNKADIKKVVSDQYFAVLSSERALIIIDSTLKVSRKLADETRQVFEVGLAEDIDVDQLDLIVSDLEAQNIYYHNQVMIAYAYLSFFLGMDDADSLVLTDKMEDIIDKRHNSTIVNDPFNVYENIDYVSMNKQKELSYLQVKLAKASYMPSLSANVNFQTQAQRDTWDFFNTKGKWYPSSVFGVSMQIPVFSSGQRRSQVKQAQIAFEQTNVSQKKLETQLRLQYSSTKNEYLNAYRVYENKQKNRKTAEKIYIKTSEKYLEGIASSLDLLNTHNQFLNAERDYIMAAQSVLSNSEELMKLQTKEE